MLIGRTFFVLPLLLSLTTTCLAESDADLSARLCRNAAATFASHDPQGEGAMEACQDSRPAAHTPRQWQCVLEEVTQGLTFYSAQTQCFKQQ